MKVETKAEEKCMVGILVTVETEEAKNIYRDVIKNVMQYAHVPGFRQGKAPLQVVKQHYGDTIKKEVQDGCIRKYASDAVKESKLDVVNYLGIKNDVVYAPETGCTFTVVVEVKPTFKLPKYKKLSIDKIDVSVADKDVDERIESLRKAYAKYDDAADDVKAAEGDFVQIDFKGTVDGQPIAELAPEAKGVAEGTGFWMQVEEGRFLPEIIKAVKGLKKGDSKQAVKVKFPKENAPEALKGKKAEYDLTVKAVRTRTLPGDEEFLKDAKAESMEKLRAETKEKMLNDATRQEENRRREYAVDSLLKKADFEVPASQVQSETQANLQRYLQQAQYSGIDADYFKANQEKILSDAREQATRQVRLSYILMGIAEAEKLEATDEDVAKRIELIAQNSGKKPEEIRVAIEKNGNMDALKGQLVAEKALEFVVNESK